jgi:hypothetical protein
MTNFKQLLRISGPLGRKLLLSFALMQKKVTKEKIKSTTQPPHYNSPRAGVVNSFHRAASQLFGPLGR